MKVRVYRNLTRDCWSVQHYVKGKGWRLLEHRDYVQIILARPKVQEAGRQRVIREKKKYVHAFPEGWMLNGEEIFWHNVRPVKYDPYKGPDFTIDGRPFDFLHVARFKPDGKVLGVL